MEDARTDRYTLLSEYCSRHGIKHLFLAHHQDDQAETFLFRLAKGSGLDGLAAMMPVQDYSPDLALLRPLLDIPKEQLVATCAAYEIPYANDPSNESEQFARPRLRKAREILEEEGLTSKRLAVTAMRLARARQALEEITDMALQDIIIDKETGRIVLDYKILRAWPGEIGLRVLLKAMRLVRAKDDYGPRMERAEALFEDLMLAPTFRKRTLGGVIIARDDKKGLLFVTAEEVK